MLAPYASPFLTVMADCQLKFVPRSAIDFPRAATQHAPRYRQVLADCGAPCIHWRPTLTCPIASSLKTRPSCSTRWPSSADWEPNRGAAKRRPLNLRCANSVRSSRARISRRLLASGAILRVGRIAAGQPPLRERMPPASSAWQLSPAATVTLCARFPSPVPCISKRPARLSPTAHCSRQSHVGSAGGSCCTVISSRSPSPRPSRGRPTWRVLMCASSPQHRIRQTVDLIPRSGR